MSEAATRGRPKRGLAFLALVVVLPLALRLWPIDHGLPRNYIPDTHLVKNSLGMARDRNPVPQVGEYSTYPNLLPYLLLPVYAGHFGLGLATERWRDAADYGEELLANPGEVHLLARILLALMGAAVPWVLYRAGRRAGLGAGAWGAAFLGATGLLAIQFSTQERPWGALVLATALACWAAISYLEGGRSRSLLACGLAAGLAFACHQAGLGILALAAFAWLLGPAERPGQGSTSGPWPLVLLSPRRILLGLAAVAAFALAGFILGHPYLLVHGATPAESVVGGAAAGDAGGLSVGGMSLIFDLRAETFTRLTRAFFGYDPVLLILGLVGLPLAWRRPSLRPLILFAVLWGGFFLTNSSDHLRYLLPLVPPLALCGGVALESLVSRGRVDGALPLGPGRLCLLVPLLALPLVQAVRFAVVLVRQDTRAEMEELLYQLPLGSRVAVDRYGPQVPLDWNSLELTRELRQACGGGLTTRERHRLRALGEDRLDVSEWGLTAVLIEDLFDVDTRAGTVSVRNGLGEYGATPAQVLAELQVTHLCRVRRRLSQASFLSQVLELGAPLGAVDPFASARARGAARAEAFLPTEMDFPLTGLWTVNRPGPLLEVLPVVGSTRAR
ncbi:MAG: hypothetical protein CMK00_06195 [Planctomycetes bacterium]|jgi:hypothetical protein|nr:hypothetical protein [Planctomycetota bacterium]HJO26630.1 glycosyltransferase family 39 protein [Planctomycetota bacterium]